MTPSGPVRLRGPRVGPKAPEIGAAVGKRVVGTGAGVEKEAEDDRRGQPVLKDEIVAFDGRVRAPFVPCQLEIAHTLSLRLPGRVVSGLYAGMDMRL